jgi:hypothetical protein
VARRFANWRTPLLPLLVASLGPTVACSVPAGLFSGMCWGFTALVNPIILSDFPNVQADNLGLACAGNSCTFVCFAIPWLGATAIGLAIGASLSAFLSRQLGQRAVYQRDAWSTTMAIWI